MDLVCTENLNLDLMVIKFAKNGAAAQTLDQHRRFYHPINVDKVFGTHSRGDRASDRRLALNHHCAGLMPSASPIFATVTR